jgi:hypothetical protein
MLSYKESSSFFEALSLAVQLQRCLTVQYAPLLQAVNMAGCVMPLPGWEYIRSKC